MALKGGYQLINLKLKEFDSTIENSYKFPELYYDILNSHSKMTILSGLALDGVKYNDYEVIFYEEPIENEICFQCILRRVWDTKNLKCITKYLTIYPNDIVKTHKDEFIYEILPDGSFSTSSTNAVQNKVVTKAIYDLANGINLLDETSYTVPTNSTFSGNMAEIDITNTYAIVRNGKLIIDFDVNNSGNAYFNEILNFPLSVASSIAIPCQFGNTDYVSMPIDGKCSVINDSGTVDNISVNFTQNEEYFTLFMHFNHAEQTDLPIHNGLNHIHIEGTIFFTNEV